jgi:hypothetical protein
MIGYEIIVVIVKLHARLFYGLWLVYLVHKHNHMFHIIYQY